MGGGRGTGDGHIESIGGQPEKAATHWMTEPSFVPSVKLENFSWALASASGYMMKRPFGYDSVVGSCELPMPWPTCSAGIATNENLR